MKKCPVCGVEHSDIVHVCSICGSSLDDAAPKAADAPEAPAAPAPAEHPPVSADLATDDIRKTISSVVNSTVEGEAGAPAAEADGVDSPFVIDARKNAAPDEPTKTVPTHRPRGNRNGKKKGNPELDTTIIAAASAQKVYAATQNAINARNAQQEPQPEPPQPEPQAPASAQEEQVWSERKHTRDKSRTSRRVVLAVCAFLILLIIAILVVFGKMIFGGNNGTPVDDKSQTELLLTEASDEAAQTPSETASEVTDIITEAPTEALTGAEEPTEDASALDPDQAVLNQDQQPTSDEQGAEPTQAPTHPAELPAITDVDDTVYAVSDVNVRDYPGTEGSNVIQVLSAGQSVKRTGTTANGWSRVEINGKVGYVSSKYLSATQPSQDQDNNSSDGTVTVSKNGVNLRDKPNGNIIATLNQGDKVKPTGKVQGSWSEVEFNGKTGYVYTKYLTGGGSGGNGGNNGGNNSDEKLTETNDTVYAISGVNVRSAPSTTGSTVLTTLSKGQKVARIGTTSNGWSKIKVGDIVGYVYSQYLSTSPNGGDNNNNNNNNNDNNGGGKKKSGYILPDSDSHVYSQSELKKLSKSQLRLARNEIYARHGRKFNDKGLQDYFNSCSWYKGTVDPATFDAHVTDYLNDVEIANLSAITQAEG